MDVYLKLQIDYELMILEETKAKYADRLYLLRDCNNVRLCRHKKKDKNLYYYYIKRPGSRKYTYLGTADHHDVKRIREARFLKVAIDRIDQNINLLKALKEGFLSIDPSSVSESLPKSYRCEVSPVSELYEIKGKEWKTKRLEFQKGFPENYPERKKHRTSDGVMVKTISELTLYERFKDAGIAIIYELPIPLKDYGPPIYPDITALSPIDMKTEIIVEFVGRLDLPEYRADFAKKIGRYLKNGYRPGVNLFFIYNGSDGNIDSIQITQVIADILGIR